MLLYIDPGTGSMLFTILIGVIGASIYSLRMLFIKLRQKLSGGKIEINDKKIPLVIFSDNKRYWNVFDPICQELDNKGVDVLYLTMSEDDPAFNCSYSHVRAEYLGSENKAFARLNFLNATILLSTTPGLDVYQWKRSKNVDYYIHIPHASNDITLYRMFGIDYYDAILLSGDYQIEDIRALEKMRNLPQKELLKVGIPYMDKAALRLENKKLPENKTKTILLAPTWGPAAIFGTWGGKIIDELLKTDYHIIIRPHPQSFDSEKELLDGLMKAFPNSERIEWNRDSDNFDVLCRSDILISDFSGVIFDFSLVHNKPVIYTNPRFDISVYDAWWLQKPLWTVSALKKLGHELNDENINKLTDIIEECTENSQYLKQIEEVKKETWAYQNEGAKRVADYLISKYEALTAKKEEK